MSVFLNCCIPVCLYLLSGGVLDLRGVHSDCSRPFSAAKCYNGKPTSLAKPGGRRAFSGFLTR